MEKCTNVVNELNSDISYNDKTVEEPIQMESAHVLHTNKIGDYSDTSKENDITMSISEADNQLSIKDKQNNLELAENSNVEHLKTVSKMHKNTTILDSDSDSESDIAKKLISNTIAEPIQIESPQVIHTEKLCDSSSKLNVIPLSLSEAENQLSIKVNQNNLELAENSNVQHSVDHLKTVSKKHKNRTILDSDSESESDIAKEFISNTIGEPIQIKSPQVIHTEKSCDSSSKSKVLTPSLSEAENELSIKVQQNNLELPENSNVDYLKTVSKKHNNRTILDSDSDSESDIAKEFTNITVENEVKEFSSDKIKTRKRIAFVDTDSETEDIMPHNKSFTSGVAGVTNPEDEPSDSETESSNTNENDKIYKRISRRNEDSEFEDGTHSKDFNSNNDSKNSEGEVLVPKTNLNGKTVPSTGTIVKEKSRLAMLCDSDSDEELSGSHVVCDDEMEGQFQHGKNIKTNKKMHLGKKTTKKSTINKAGSETTKKMTPKEAAELRKEIQSESQRMMREKNVSLPYHKPKAHSLKEFLTRRPRLAIAVSRVQAPPSVAIKMSTEQLEIISNKMKEREIEVKQFYQSESDDEDSALPTDDTNKSDEEVKQTSKSLQDQENSNDDINTNDLEDISKSAAEVEGPKENVEGESVIRNPVDTQNTEKLTNCIDDCRGTVQDNIDETAVTDKPTLEGEPMETSDIPQTEPQTDPDRHNNMDSQSLGQSAVSDISQQINTENYDFHLDDENTEKVISSHTMLGDSEHEQSSNLKDNAEISELEQVPETLEPEPDHGLSELAKESTSKPFIYSDLDIEIENYGNSENVQGTSEDISVDEPVLPPVKSKLDILKEKLANIKPRLRGGPDRVIDLDSILAKPKGVVELMERFTKHMTTKKHHSKHKVKLSIVTVESGGDIHKETVAVNVDSDDDEVVREEIPGAKFQRLREELQKQMDQKKSEIWQQKAARGIRESEETNKDGDHIEKDEKDDFYYDEEEEAEMTEEEDTEEEFENEIELSDKPRKKSAFLDQEAEESDNNDDEIEHKEDYEEGILNEEDTVEESDRHVEDNEDSNMTNEQTASAPDAPNESSVEGKKVLRRILKPEDDSDEEDLFSDSIIQKTTSIEQLDSTVTADEEDIPPHQTRQLQTPMRQQALSQMKSISDFLTPISFITSIQNLASANKGNRNEPAISPFRMPSDLSQTTEERSTVSQKILFTDSEVMESQESLGTQTVTQTEESSTDVGRETDSLQTSQLEADEEPPSTQDLMGICSGEFTGVTQLEPSNDTRKFIEFDGSQSNEFKSLGTDQDMVISQLLDEEELENFKKKFESPVNPTTQPSVYNETQEFTGGGILDSDDEDNEECGLRKRKNQRRIQFSDDENSDEENNDNAEEIDLQDDVDDQEIDNIGYDSEENEVDLNDIGKKKIRMTDFLEAEAELSESDWDSEDEEDNDDMDKLEFELGDTEKFDEDQVKEDLEKIHLRRMLDDDAREVKLLQEVLLEDGEMHGTGRQRQFKWKNIDVTDETVENKDEDDIFLDVEESEEEWRKKRHEREMFLKEKQHKSQQPEYEDDLLNHSQLLKIGQKVLQRSRSQNIPAVESTNDVVDEPVGKIPFSLLSKRGSFLSRSDQVLQRLADYTKISAGVSLNSTKTTKNFVFQSASASEVSIAAADIKKRKASEGTPNVIKKLRLDSTFNNEMKTKRSKKLFNF